MVVLRTILKQQSYSTLGLLELVILQRAHYIVIESFRMSPVCALTSIRILVIRTFTFLVICSTQLIDLLTTAMAVCTQAGT